MTGQRREGSISVPRASDTWTFHADAGNFVLLGAGELVDNGGFSPYIQLFGPDGVRVAGAMGESSAQIAQSVALSGSYRVTVTSHSGSGDLAGTGTYRLTMALVPSPFLTASGGALTNGERHEGSIDVAEIDTWTFSAGTGDRILLSLAKSGGEAAFTPSLQLFRPDGVRVAGSSSSTVAQIETAAALAGLYTVLVSAGGGRTGSYRLTLAKAPGAFIVPAGDQGGPMTNGARHEGTIDAGDVDMWSFTAAAGDRIFLSVADVSERAEFFPSIQLIRPDGARAAAAQGPYAAQVNETAAISGTYTVTVTSNTGPGSEVVDGTGTYRLTLAKAPGAFIVSPSDQGGFVLRGSTNSGSIDTGDIDLWSFDAAAGERIAIRLDVTVSPGGGFYPLIQLMGPDGRRVALATGGGLAQIVEIAPLTGIYTIFVSSNSGNGFPGNVDASGSYSLQVNVLANPPALTSIRVTSPNGSVKLGLTEQLAAIATYSDGSTADITTQATWVSANTSVAVVSINGGLVTGIATGSTTFTASLLGVASSAFPLPVVPGFSLTSISPNPAAVGRNIFNLTGAGFDPATAQVEFANVPPILNSQLISATETQIVFSADLGAATHQLTVRNGPGGPRSVNILRLTVSARVVPPRASHFVPIAPCRAVDTRTTSAVEGDTTRVFGFSACGVPPNATAVAANITLVPSGPFGYLSIWPADQDRPTVSTMNSLDGRVKANAAIVGLGGGGAVLVYATDRAHVILDVSGYFVPAGTPGALAFYPVAPCRVLDTRDAGGVISAAGTRKVSGGCLPAQAQAYWLNVTVAPPAPLGYLTLWPDGQPQPGVSTLNDLTGTVVANAAILRAGNGGAINAYVTDASHLIVDLNGYFAPPGSLGALAFYPVLPCRILDTRRANGPYGGPRMQADAAREFLVPFSGCGVPSEAQAYVTNATVIPSGVFGFLTMWPGDQARPTVSTLNAVDGALTSNAAILPASSSGAIRIYASNAADLLLDVSGYFAP